MLIKRYICKKW